MAELFYLLALLSVFASKTLLGKWFNHISIYFVIWAGMIYFYELRFMAYFDLSPYLWGVVFSGSLSFLFGAALYPLLLKVHPIPEKIPNDKLKASYLEFFTDDKLLSRLILWFSLIGLAAALHHWWILISKFGSLQNIFINFNTIYRMRLENQIEGIIPYIYVASYAGVLFGGIKVAKDGNVSFLSLLPFFGVIIKEMANVARAGILFAFILFICSIFFSRFAIEKIPNARRVPFFSFKNVATLVIVIGLAISAAGLVRSFRGTIESFTSSSSELRAFKDNFFITPSLYLYVSSHIGVLNKYLEQPPKEYPQYGEGTFFSLYNILARFDLASPATVYDKGYFIPMWTNTSTVYKQLHQDFGLPGVFIPPFLMGLFCSFFWKRFFARLYMLDFVILVFLTVAVAFSFLAIVTKVSIWIISLISILLIIKLIGILKKMHVLAGYSSSLSA